ncbi:MAG: hypothetical protein IPJ48_21400 [Propionivibrio sp.]|uniref:Uncharacterized protein n=1 Tax=Candidatus Propionivibrio dominans TaxID=2954373 RepID=A0A9D7I9I6_9RHOO|nr:hypothetical protein [Candidatus Propionivibrio dominans]
MGMGARNVTARVAASLGGLVAVAPHFEPALDVPHGGVLLALPLLLALGLLDHTEGRLELPDGYYGLDSILLLLAFMALARLETVEDLRYHPPGECWVWIGCRKCAHCVARSLTWGVKETPGNGVRRCANAG